MTVYVDRWCHLFADDVEELHVLAARIGMKRAWFQHRPGRLPHYDLVPPRRAAALAAGAVEVGREKLVELIRKERERSTHLAPAGFEVALVCIKRPRPARCSVCKARPHTRLCDGPGKRPGKTCNAKLCDRCAKHVGPDRDLCPACGLHPELPLVAP